MNAIKKTLTAAAVGFSGMIGSAAAQEDPSQTELFNQFAACYETESGKVDQDIERQRAEQTALYEAMDDAEIDSLYAELAGVTDLSEDQARRIYASQLDEDKIFLLAELVVLSEMTASEFLNLSPGDLDQVLDKKFIELQNATAEDRDGIFEQVLPGVLVTIKEAARLSMAQISRDQKISDLLDQMTFVYENPAVICAEQLGIDNATAYDWQDKTLRRMMDRQLLSP